ncbi:hypothetical protein [Rhizobium leguminosarum]|uniref:hypothetical protein n=1 Tax=Rhizobium leguminosarum TaxID=384 RepID=UPI000363D308|nr:hypothetical protein [Rhizobium leguminosarum]
MTDSVDLPNPSDPDVITLMGLHKLSGIPDFIHYEDHGYEPRFCHLSAKDIAKKRTGRRVHGRAFWRFNATLPDGTRSSFILAEHHSVWETPAGKLVDVTPPAHHPSTVLFLRDDSAIIVRTNDDLLMLSDLSDFDKMPWFFGGLPVTVRQMIMPDEIRGQAGAYAIRIGFDMSDYPTDPTYG